jgi:hypothetical protein
MNALKSILERTIELLAKSEASDWTTFTPEEVAQDLARASRAIETGTTIDKDKLAMHFTPTGPLQEIAMSNGWADEYLKLAEEFDQKIK